MELLGFVQKQGAKKYSHYIEKSEYNGLTPRQLFYRDESLFRWKSLKNTFSITLMEYLFS